MKLSNLAYAILPFLLVTRAEVDKDQHAQHDDRPIQKRASPMEPYYMKTRGGYEVTLGDYKNPKMPLEVAMQYLVASMCDLFESVSPPSSLCVQINAGHPSMLAQALHSMHSVAASKIPLA